MAYIVAATANAHKVDEYRKLLEGQNVELKSLLDYPGFPGVEENGRSFIENAGIKALAACRSRRLTAAPASIPPAMRRLTKSGSPDCWTR